MADFRLQGGNSVPSHATGCTPSVRDGAGGLLPAPQRLTVAAALLESRPRILYHGGFCPEVLPPDV